ncbi:hypothetical protein [Candidatus Methylacidithermus pantelleriae]|nr:hypothetical protein [Candidatus Methylacidithermus pantelleriae]
MLGSSAGGKGRVAGVDGQAFQRIEERGVEGWLDRWVEERSNRKVAAESGTTGVDS